MSLRFLDDDLLVHGLVLVVNSDVASGNSLVVALKDVHVDSLELASRHSGVEASVDLLVGETARLGEAEVDPDGAEEGHASPVEGSLAAPVPCGRVEHVGHVRAVDNANDTVEGAAKVDGLDGEATGRDLSHERVADGANGELVGNTPHEKHDAGSPRRGGSVNGGNAADNEQNGAHPQAAIEVECTATDTSAHERPGDEGSTGVDGVLAHGHREGVLSGETGLLLKIVLAVGRD